MCIYIWIVSPHFVTQRTHKTVHLYKNWDGSVKYRKCLPTRTLYWSKYGAFLGKPSFWLVDSMVWSIITETNIAQQQIQRMWYFFYFLCKILRSIFVTLASHPWKDFHLNLRQNHYFIKLINEIHGWVAFRCKISTPFRYYSIIVSFHWKNGRVR